MVSRILVLLVIALVALCTNVSLEWRYIRLDFVRILRRMLMQNVLH